MNIYEIVQNYEDYKFFVFKEDGESSKRTLDFNGQSLAANWKELNLQIFKDKRKKKDNRSDNFDASCYFSGCLVVKQWAADMLKDRLHDLIEVLPVKVDSPKNECFFFVNVLTVIDSVNKDGKDNAVILDMLRRNDVIFKKENIDSYMLFRDNIFTQTYYCTEDFVNLINNQGVNGLKFEVVGKI